MKSKKNKQRKSAIRNKTQPAMVIPEATFTGTFTTILDVATTFASGISSYNLVLTAANFTRLNTFQALFQYYTPKRLDSSSTLRTSADNGLIIRIRPLHPIADGAFTTSVISPSNLVSDPNSIQCIANRINHCKPLKYKDTFYRLATTGTSDKLAELNVVLPVAQDASGTATTVITIHLVVTFYRMLNA
jgi:hypothetical protein